jgi:hypothetical protein
VRNQVATPARGPACEIREKHVTNADVYAASKNTLLSQPVFDTVTVAPEAESVAVSRNAPDTSIRKVTEI